MNYDMILYKLLENTATSCPLLWDDTVDLNKLRKLLLIEYPGKYHLEWVNAPLKRFDIVDPSKIKIIYHTDDEHIEWILKYG